MNAKIITTFVLLYALGAFSLHAQSVPSPIGQKFPAEMAPEAFKVNKSTEQVEEIECSPAYVHGDVGFKEKPGSSFTLTMWFMSSDPDIMGSSVWDKYNMVPMSVVNLRSESGQDEMIVRLMKNRIMLTSTNNKGKNWPGFATSTILEPYKWYFLSVTMNNQEAIVYVNGVFSGNNRGFPLLKEIDSIAYGRVGEKRFFHGTILQPRIYKGALSQEQIQGLYGSSRPSVIPQESVGHAESVPVTYGIYPWLEVAKDELHPIVDQLHIGATVIDDPKDPSKKNILLGNLPMNLFGARVAFLKPEGVDPAGLPYYDNGTSLKNTFGDRFFAAKHPDGTTYIYAQGNNTPLGGGTLVRYPVTHYDEKGLPQFGEEEIVTAGGKGLLSAFTRPICSWAVTDIDGDGIPDLVVSSIKPGTSPDNYMPDGQSMWKGVARENSGPGRGYDIAGNWLGQKCTSQFFWAKGSMRGKQLTFAERKPIYYQHEGFIAQWVAWERERAINIVTLQGKPTLLHAGDIDKVYAMPITVKDGGTIILEKAVPLLETGPSVQGTYFIHNISILDEKEDGTCRLLLDGNPGRLIVVEGKKAGAFKELGPLQTKGGPVAVDTLATPIRGQWDEDDYPDLIVGDSSGLLTLWRGTVDPLVYHAGRVMTSNGTPVQHQADETGSIQGPCERRWGYLQPTMGDWDGDMEPEIITGDIWGKITLYKKASDAKSPYELGAPKVFQKDGEDYMVAWRTRPAIIPSHYNFLNTQRPVLLHIDWDGDLAVAVTESNGSTKITEVVKLRNEDGNTIRLSGPAGLWGRTKLSISEWNTDGKWHIVFGTSRETQNTFVSELLPGASPLILENVGTNARPVFKAPRSIRMKDGMAINFDIHNASASASNLMSKEGERPDLIVGAEDGKIYYFPRSALNE